MATITQLEYILAVARERHFGMAARECHVSQPSLSAQIQKLEDELGVTIFDRSRKPIGTTEIGQEIVDQAQTIIREHRKLQVIADSKSVTPKGDFELAVIPTLAPYVIPLFIGDFGESYPEVNLSINEYKTEDIVRLLINEEIDAGLLVTPLEDDRILEKPLFYEPFYCYINREHPLSSKTEITAEDLDTHDLWLLSEGHCFREQVLNVCSSHAEKRALPSVRFESGNLETLIKLVRANTGFTLLPQLAVDELPASELTSQIRKFSSPVPTREVSLVHTRSFQKETIINALSNSILRHLPQGIKSLQKKNIDIIDIGNDGVKP